MGKGEDTRRAVLDLALSQATRLGLEGLTIGTLAAEAGLSKSGLYAHFNSKEQLQLDVVDAARDRFVAIVVEPAMREPRGEPRLRAVVERWLDWDDEEPGGCLFVAASNELDDRPGPVRDRLVRHQQEWVSFLAKGARLAIAEGHFRADVDPDLFAFQLWGVILAYHFYRRLLRDPDTVRRARAALEDLIRQSRA